MKLYTEEQVKNIINSTKVYINKFGIDEAQPVIENYLKMLTPIQLPSDDEIETESHNHYLKGQLYIEPASDTEYAFKKGAKWMKEQILNQNK